MTTLLRKHMFLFIFLFMLSCDKNSTPASKQLEIVDMANINYVDDPYLIPVIQQLQIK